MLAWLAIFVYKFRIFVGCAVDAPQKSVAVRKINGYVRFSLMWRVWLKEMGKIIIVCNRK